MVRRLEPDIEPRPAAGNFQSGFAGTAVRYAVGVLCVTGILLFSLCFSVQEGRQAVVLRFGEPVRVADQAGLHLKAPWPVERVTVVDGRIRSISTPKTELLTRDKKNIVLVTGGAWRPGDPIQFYRALGSIENADEKVTGLLINAKIAVFGRYDLSALASTDQATLLTERIELDILDEVNEVAATRYGIEVTHIGFQRLSLPARNVVFVLEQMRAERRQFAARFRANGELEAAQIRSNADLEAARIIASATEEAARIAGQGEAQAAQIYADAYAKDPDFYRFVRSLDTLEKSLGPSTYVTLRTDAHPFSLLIDQRASVSYKPLEVLPVERVDGSTLASKPFSDAGKETQ